MQRAGRNDAEGRIPVNRFPSLGVAVWAWRGALALAVRPALWPPLLLVTAVQIVLLWLLLAFHHGGVSLVGFPLVRLLGGEGAAHYPTLYFALPAMFSRANLAISLLVGALAGGVTTVLVARAFGFQAERDAWRLAWRRAPALIATTGATLLLLFGATLLVGLVPREATVANGPLRWGLRAASLGVLVVIQALLVYSTAWIVLMGHGVWPALRDSVRVTMRTLLPTLIAVGVSALIHFPISFALGRLDLFVGKLKPEVVVGLLGLQIGVQLLITFLLVGAVTRLFLWRTEAAQ